MKVTEATIQAVLMSWAMNEKHHPYVVPNSNQFFNWEADLITVTQAGLAHEYEIKLNRADYSRDAVKRKHRWVGDYSNAPSYFWYVTFGFEIEPPDKAGWIMVRLDKSTWRVDVKKHAPRLNTWRLSTQKQIEIARLLSWRLTNFYRRYSLKLTEELTNGAGEDDRLERAAREWIAYYDKHGAREFNRRFGAMEVHGDDFIKFLREFLQQGTAQSLPTSETDAHSV